MSKTIRTVVIGDEAIIKEFRDLCRKNGRIVSHVILGFMITHIQQAKIDARKTGRKKEGRNMESGNRL